MVMPKYDYVTYRFMWSCVMGIKKYMSNNSNLKGLAYLRHKPGVRIKENSISNWCDYLDKFKGW